MPYVIRSINPRGNSEIQLGWLTVLVGPNNSGKSQTLKDIRQFTSSGSTERLVVLDNLNANLPTEAELRGEVQIRPDQNSLDIIRILGVRDDLLTPLNSGVHKTWFEQNFTQSPVGTDKVPEILRGLGTCLIAYLGAEARFKLTTGSPGFNPRVEAPSNAIQSLFAADVAVRSELRAAFRAAFSVDIGLDWAAMTRFYLRVAKNFGDIPDDRTKLDSLMVDAEELEHQGDGFRSFAGVALALLTYPTRVLLLDEPEAFLHPAQARTLGRWVGGQATKHPAQIVIATHSADFLAGLFAANKEATIVRLNRIGDSTTFHRISDDVISGLIDSPLLSSQPVLGSLFHEGVLICEGDPDRAVYQTVAQSHPRGGEFLFIHSNGKDAAKYPAKLLRKSGTPVCVIADFDVLNSEQTLRDIAQALTGSELEQETIQLRNEISMIIETKSQAQSFEELKAEVSAWCNQQHDDLRLARKNLVSCARAGSNKWNRAKKIGISCMSNEDAAKASRLIERLAARGLFVVPCGELESWMSLGLPKGSKWNQAALQALHGNNCPEELRKFVVQALVFLAPELALQAVEC